MCEENNIVPFYIGKSEKFGKNNKNLSINIKTNNPQLKTNIYFWIKAWNSNDIELWEDFAKTSLTFLEYQMIGTCSKLFPNDLLNFEGVNR